MAALLALVALALLAPNASAAGPKPSGGPDAKNYMFVTSELPDGPTYDWYDISGTGTKVDMTNNNGMCWQKSVSSAVPIGFAFQFYDKEFATLRISDAGVVLFDKPSTGECYSSSMALYGIAQNNGYYPSSSLPNWQVAGFLNAGGFGLMPGDPTSGMYYETVGEAPNRIMIVQWHNMQTCHYYYAASSNNGVCGGYSYNGMDYYKGDGPTSFQIKLFEQKGAVETHVMEAKGSAGLYNYYTCSSVGIEGSGKQVGKKWEALAFTNQGQSTWCYQPSPWVPPAEWAIRYVQNKSPVAQFDNFAVPSNVYHNGRAADDDAELPDPEPDYYHPDSLVLFMDRSFDPDGEVVSWEWDFGDGTKSTERNPSHSYNNGSQVYEVKLTVGDGFSKNTFKGKVQTFENEAPVIDFKMPLTGVVGQPVAIEDISSDVDGKVKTYFWDFGDGTVSTLQNPPHVFLKAGTFKVKLVAQDDDGAGGEAMRTVRILSTHDAGVASLADRPEANAGADQSVKPGDVVGLRGYQVNGAAEVYRWEQVAGPRVALAGLDSATPSFTAPQPAAGPDGRMQQVDLLFELVVADKGRDSLPDTVKVTVVPTNAAPVVQQGATRVVAPGDEVALQVAATDADGDSLTYKWTQYSGQPVTLSSAASQNPTFLAPMVDEPVDLVFRVTANDGQVASVPATVTVSVQPGEKGFAFADQGLGLVAMTPAVAGSGFFWDFGDGTTSTEANPTHRYAQSGDYVVRLTMLDMDGNPVTYTYPVHVFIPPEGGHVATIDSRDAPGAALLAVIGLLGIAVATRRT